MNFALMKHHEFKLTELNEMMRFERDIYVLLLKQWLEEEARRLREQARKT